MAEEVGWAIERFGANGPLVVHVPHAATAIPDDVRQGIELDDDALDREVELMTDWHTDLLAAGALTRAGTGASMFRNRWSRLVIDPERFPDDREPMAARGMGAVYRSTSGLGRLRDPSPVEEARLLDRCFRPYAAAVGDLVDEVLDLHGQCVLVDLHSYPSRPLLYESDPSAPRPGVCIGTDPFHTPDALRALAEEAFATISGGTALDTPFAGTYVPVRHFETDRRVSSVMIEIRRDQYLDEPSTVDQPRFDALVDRLAAFLAAVDEAVRTGRLPPLR